MAATGHERYSEDLGAYLLGALPDLEAEALERHAMHCDACRDELERLRPGADALPHSVEQYEPPASLKRSLMAAVESDLQAAGRAPEPRRERRMSRLAQLLASRPAYALAGAAAVLVIGFAVGFGIDRATRGGSGAAAITGGLRGADRVLVTRERAGGAPRPTEPPVISIRT